MDEYVPAAVATLLVSHNKILLGKRFVNRCFEGWQCPGGFLQLHETLESAAQRVCLQKAGIQIDAIEQGPFTNNLFHASSVVRHSVTLYAIARAFKVIDSDLYADEQRSWQWFEIDEIPSPRFQPLQQLLDKDDLRSLLNL